MQRVALLQALIPLGPGAVALDALEANVFLKQRRGQQGQTFGHKAVQPLTGIVFSDGDLPHEGASLTVEFPVCSYSTVFFKKVKIFMRKCLTRGGKFSIILLVSLRGVL